MKSIAKDYGIYFLILLFGIIIRIMPQSTGRAEIDAAINDIAIGCIASAVVAWLIYLEENQRIKKRNEILRAVVMLPFLKSLVHYMEQFCLLSAFMPPEFRSKKKTFV